MPRYLSTYAYITYIFSPKCAKNLLLLLFLGKIIPKEAPGHTRCHFGEIRSPKRLELKKFRFCTRVVEHFNST